MIDIALIRNNPQIVEENLKFRKDNESLDVLKQVIKSDLSRRDMIKQAEDLKRKRNQITKELAESRTDEKIKSASEISERIKMLDKLLASENEKFRTLMLRLPNILHESVPQGAGEEENVEVRKWGSPPPMNFEPKAHQELAGHMMELERAAKISGARFYFLSGHLAMLHMAVIRFAADELQKKGFNLLIPPFMIKREPYEGVAPFEDFEKVMYKAEGDDLYMIATSEHPLVSMFKDETFVEDELPVRLAGVSSCFRKEAGTHGKDTKGIFRVHQFDKVEQIIISRPEDSWDLHEELIRNAETIMQKLGLHYRVVNICTGDIGVVAAKKYDIEAWMPAQGKFREMVSGSNCTDYQARRLNMKYGKRDSPAKGFVHTLNCTAVASPRILVAIMENYQKEDGSIEVPNALRPYMNARSIQGKAF